MLLRGLRAMPKRQQKSQDECANPESSVSQVEGDPGSEVSAPAAMRTRSGRRIRAPSSFLDSEVLSPAKTSRRRLKSNVEMVAESELGDTAAPQECITNMDIDTGSEPEVKIIRRDASKPSSPSKEPPVGVAPETTEPADSAAVPGHGGSEKGNNTSVKTINNATKRSANSHSGGKQGHMIPIGRPKSGRVWKNRNKQRYCHHHIANRFKIQTLFITFEYP